MVEKTLHRNLLLPITSLPIEGLQNQTEKTPRAARADKQNGVETISVAGEESDNDEHSDTDD